MPATRLADVEWPMSGFMVFAIIFGVWLSLILGGLATHLHRKRRGLEKGSVQEQLEDIKAALHAIDERTRRMEERHADDVLDAHRADAALAPGELEDG
jgi:sensor histidine kinase regulating citrate/malate metabolism